MKKILVVLVSLLLMTGCSKTKTIDDVSVKTSSNDKIKLSVDIVDKEKVAVTAQNVSGKDIQNATINLAFFDSKDELIKTEKENLFNLRSGAKNVLVLMKEYPNVKRIIATANISMLSVGGAPLIYVEDKIQTSIEEKGNSIIARIKNNSGKVVDNIDSAVVLYKNNKIVAVYPFHDTGLAVSKENEITLASSNGSKIDYDNVEMVINNAYIIK